MKECGKCKEILPLDSFGKDKPRPDGLSPYCRSCKRGMQRKYYKASPERYRARNYRDSYGITLEQYDEMLAEQGGCCANPGCNKQEPGGIGRFHVDHNHTTGEVRGLLCHGCNTSAGLCQDNPVVLQGLANYLEERGYYG
jgi:hypothetical protein